MHTRRMVTIHRNRDKKVSQNYSSSKDSPHSFFNTHSYLIDYIDYNNVDRFIEENNKVFVKHTYNKVAIKHFGIFRMSQDFNCTRVLLVLCLFQQQNLRKRLRLSEDDEPDSKQKDTDATDHAHTNSDATYRVPLMQLSNQPTVRSTHVRNNTEITESFVLFTSLV